MIQARKDYRLDKESLNNMFVRTESGEMAPVGQFITLTKVYGAETLTRADQGVRSRNLDTFQYVYLYTGQRYASRRI